MRRCRSVLWVSAAVLAMALFTTGAALAANWPTRTINTVVFSAAGGSTDLSNRAIGAALEKELGTTINVVNMPGAQGGVAAAYVWNAARDGYTWFGMSEGALGLAVLGAHPTTTKDWEYFLVGGTPGIISVRANSPYRTLEDLVAAARANPGQIRIATSIPGCVWHVQYLTIARDTGLSLRWVPYDGSRPSQVAALSGEVDVVLTGLGEQIEFLRAGQLRPLAVVDTKPLQVEGIGTIRPVTDVLPEVAPSLPIRQFVGFALPADTPKEVLQTIEAAFHRAMDSEPVANFLKTTLSDRLGLSGAAAKELASQQERLFAWTLYEQGIATHSPEEFGIARP